MITQILNKSDVEQLFNKESIFIGNDNVIPVKTAERLFGKDATSYGFDKPGEDFNVYTIKGNVCEYLYYRGFKKAATYHNISNILEDFNAVEDKNRGTKNGRKR